MDKDELLYRLNKNCQWSLKDLYERKWWCYGEECTSHRGCDGDCNKKLCGKCADTFLNYVERVLLYDYQGNSCSKCVENFIRTTKESTREYYPTSELIKWFRKRQQCSSCKN